MIELSSHEIIRDLKDKLAETRAERDRLRDACSKQNDEIGQILGAALGYPRYCDDQQNFPGSTAADGVCVGEHTAESLAAEAAEAIAERDDLRRRLAEAEQAYGEVSASHRRQSEQIDQLRQRLKASEAARAKLREALVGIRDHDPDTCSWINPRDCLELVQGIAVAALKEKPQP